MIWLMNSTTTRLDPRVRAAMMPLLASEEQGGVAQGATRSALDAARAEVGRFCGADPAQIVFTSGGTEACNVALKGPALWALSRNDERRRILALSTEHTAVLYPMRTLGRLGFDAREIPVDRQGVVDLAALEDLLKVPTLLVAMAPANAETGTFQPLDGVVALAHRRGALVHADACLTAAYGGIDVGALGVDMASFSAHKIGGPKGAGAFWARDGVRLLPLLEGGVNEGGRRGGAENVAGIAGFAAAARIWKDEGSQIWQRLEALGSRLESALLRTQGVECNGGAARRLPGMVNVSVPGLDGEALITKLALRGVAVSSGSSCFQETGKPSHVLLAMGLDALRARGSVLFSLGRDTTDADVDRVIEVFPQVVASLKALGPDDPVRAAGPRRGR